MATIIDSARPHMLADARAKRETALRCARGADRRDEEFWLGIAGRMTEWIEHLESQPGTRGVPTLPGRVVDGALIQLRATR
jgi:hypothetical protein